MRLNWHRFTDQMLADYAAALGLRPWDEDFYPGGFGVVSYRAPRVPEREFTLEQARARLGLDHRPL